MRAAADGKAAFIAVACAPGLGGSTLEFLIKVAVPAGASHVCMCMGRQDCVQAGFSLGVEGQ
jgi:hypothetical protein